MGRDDEQGPRLVSRRGTGRKWPVSEAIARVAPLLQNDDRNAFRGMLMVDKERRRALTPQQIALRRELNEAQNLTLASLEAFGWELKFIRRPMFQAPVPVVFDGDRKTYAVLEADGTLNENPGFKIRE
jgi:hypothetical protein